ncbi:MAG: Asp-tRNA(Asn)/Glu-tRNA(Gln) amidotransferase subunit GatB [Candidatus Dormibacteria bacterium]
MEATETARSARPAPAGWETVIGLEVHAQLLTESKMFCGCSTRYLEAPPNANVCPLCLGLPGVLPVANRAAIDLTIRTGIALNCRIPEHSKFDRKHYFYPDLPKGYQISQYDQPLCAGGWLAFRDAAGELRRAGITRVHLEEDTGKLVHVGDSLHQGGGSAVNLNRCGVPLMEIVGEPDLRSPEEARDYMMALRGLLRWIGVCDGNLEEGSLRCDANVSVRRAGDEALGVKVEIKNMNSFRAVQRALEYEVERQVRALEAGETLVQETRGWVDGEGVTRPQRSKEFAHDYRYFPEPDLPPLVVDEAWRDRIAAALPELPGECAERLERDFELTPAEAAQLTAEREWAAYFEEAVALGAEARPVANWMLHELAGRLKEQGVGIGESPLPASALAGLVRLIQAGTISGKMAKELFEVAYTSGEDPAAIAAREGMAQISDEGELALVVDRVLAANPQAITDYRAGNQRALGALVGAVMRETGGRGNPKLVNRLLTERVQSGGG